MRIRSRDDAAAARPRSAVEPPASPAVAGSLDNQTLLHLRRGGAAVPYRADLERSFGMDFSGVTARTGQAQALAGIGATAATHGEQIDFASTSPSRATVAHELAHVAQARIHGPGPELLSSPSDASEIEAHQVAARAANGEAVSVSERPRARMQRTLAVDGKDVDRGSDVFAKHAFDPVRREVLAQMIDSKTAYKRTALELDFELELRSNTVKAARDLADAPAPFAPDEHNIRGKGLTNWVDDGKGIKLAPGAKPAAAIRELYEAFKRGDVTCDCYSFAQIVTYKAILDTAGNDKDFARALGGTLRIDSGANMPIPGLDQSTMSFNMSGAEPETFAGDVVAIENPDFDPAKPAWARENTVQVENRQFVGHVGPSGSVSSGQRVKDEKGWIDFLKPMRKPGASELPERGEPWQIDYEGLRKRMRWVTPATPLPTSKVGKAAEGLGSAISHAQMIAGRSPSFRSPLAVPGPTAEAADLNPLGVAEGTPQERANAVASVFRAQGKYLSAEAQALYAMAATEDAIESGAYRKRYRAYRAMLRPWAGELASAIAVFESSTSPDDVAKALARLKKLQTWYDSAADYLSGVPAP